MAEHAVYFTASSGVTLSIGLCHFSALSKRIQVCSVIFPTCPNRLLSIIMLRLVVIVLLSLFPHKSQNPSKCQNIVKTSQHRWRNLQILLASLSNHFPWLFCWLPRCHTLQLQWQVWQEVRRLAQSNQNFCSDYVQQHPKFLGLFPLLCLLHWVAVCSKQDAFLAIFTLRQVFLLNAYLNITSTSFILQAKGIILERITNLPGKKKKKKKTIGCLPAMKSSQRSTGNEPALETRKWHKSCLWSTKVRHHDSNPNSFKIYLQVSKNCKWYEK